MENRSYPESRARLYGVGLLLVALVASAALRLSDLGYRPMHGDEAVHAVKFNALWQDGRYVYDPHEYHGPTLYYAAWPLAWLSGADSFGELSSATLRLAPALVGVAIVLLSALLARDVGWPTAGAIALLTAVSPAMVYYSRYFIQETLLVCFTFAAILAGWRLVRRPTWGWAVALGAALGLMQATKETCVIVWGAAALAGGATWLWQGRRTPRGDWRHLTLVVGSAIVVSAALMTAGFTNLAGFADSWRAYVVYANRGGGGEGLHLHPWHFYLRLLMWHRPAPGPAWSEGLILTLGAVGVGVALRGRGAAKGADLTLLRFLTLYALLLTLAYSILPYKTPWSMLGFLHGWIILAGVGATALVTALRPTALRVGAVLLLAAGVAHLAQQARAASWRFCCDPRNPYAYAHPLRDVEQIGELARRLYEIDDSIAVAVVSPNPWPLPWQLRDVPHVGYWESAAEANAAGVLTRHSFHAAARTEVRGSFADVVIVSGEAQAALTLPEDDWFTAGPYALRRGELHYVCVRDALWDAYVERQATP